MSITLTLPPELEQRLEEESERQNISLEEYTIQLLDQHAPTSEKNRKLIALLQSWIDASDEEKAEQQETGAYLIRVLDEDRTSERKLFPKDLKGITW